jgi:hypothetical protein
MKKVEWWGSKLIIQRRREAEIVAWITRAECRGLKWKTWWYMQ